jgi:hypothetical protein
VSKIYDSFFEERVFCQLSTTENMWNLLGWIFNIKRNIRSLFDSYPTCIYVMYKAILWITHRSTNQWKLWRACNFLPSKKKSYYRAISKYSIFCHIDLRVNSRFFHSSRFHLSKLEVYTVYSKVERVPVALPNTTITHRKIKIRA